MDLALVYARGKTLFAPSIAIPASKWHPLPAGKTMPVALSFFMKYGYFILFFWVMTEQIGVPIPSAPLLITAGTLTATHRLNLPLVLIAIVLGWNQSHGNCDRCAKAVATCHQSGVQPHG